MLETVLFCLFGFIILNLAAAGVVALLAAKAPAVGRRRRTYWTIGITGALTALMFLGFAVKEGPGEAWLAAAVLAVICTGAAILSLPGAIIMGRALPSAMRLGDTFA